MGNEVCHKMMKPVVVQSMYSEVCNHSIVNFTNGCRTKSPIPFPMFCFFHFWCPRLKQVYFIHLCKGGAGKAVCTCILLSNIVHLKED